MSLRDLAEHARDKQLKCAFRNAFAILTNAEIYAVCEAMSGMSPAAAADTIIELLGPEEERVATLIPATWGAGDLADRDVAAKLLAASASYVGKPPTKDDAKKTADALPLTQEEKQDLEKDIEHSVLGAVDWGMVGLVLSKVAIAVVAKRLPILRFAPNSQAIIKGVGTVAGAAFGAYRAHEEALQQQQKPTYLPPTAR